jgi:CRISPR-associated protein Csx10
VQRFKVTITAQSPLCFSERRPAGQFRESSDYIPGTVLRGAAAALMLEHSGDVSEEFKNLFTGPGQAVFTNAYPAPGVLPATALSCKNVPGFTPDGHGISDSLIRDLCFEGLRPAGPTANSRCKECGIRMERHRGFYEASTKGYSTRGVSQRLLTRVAINRRRATAEDGMLYSPIVISEATPDGKGGFSETTFVSTITAPASGDALRTYVAQVEHLGSGSARGLGHVRLDVEPDEETGDRATIKGRAEGLNKSIADSWDLLSRLPGCSLPPTRPETGTFFTIGFLSDAILKEEAWMPSIILTEHILAQSAGVEDSSLTLVRAHSGRTYRGGWNAALGRPKDIDVAIPLGSVFVFWTQQIDLWEGAFPSLEILGIGERTTEGFGQLRICDDFHNTHGGIV